MGRHFEELSPGLCIEAGPRTISHEDVAAFAEVSGDRTALHTDQAYAATTPFGGIVAHGALVLSAATGLAYVSGAFEGTVLAVRSMDVTFARPVRPGDTLHLRLTVASREDRPRPDRGRVRFDVEVRNQDDRTVLSGTWAMVIRRQIT